MKISGFVRFYLIVLAGLVVLHLLASSEVSTGLLVVWLIVAPLAVLDRYLDRKQKAPNLNMVLVGIFLSLVIVIVWWFTPQHRDVVGQVGLVLIPVFALFTLVRWALVWDVNDGSVQDRVAHTIGDPVRNLLHVVPEEQYFEADTAARRFSGQLTALKEDLKKKTDEADELRTELGRSTQPDAIGRVLQTYTPGRVPPVVYAEIRRLLGDPKTAPAAPRELTREELADRILNTPLDSVLGGAIATLVVRRWDAFEPILVGKGIINEKMEVLPPSTSRKTGLFGRKKIDPKTNGKGKNMPEKGSSSKRQDPNGGTGKRLLLGCRNFVIGLILLLLGIVTVVGIAVALEVTNVIDYPVTANVAGFLEDARDRGQAAIEWHIAKISSLTASPTPIVPEVSAPVATATLPPPPVEVVVPTEPPTGNDDLCLVLPDMCNG